MKKIYFFLIAAILILIIAVVGIRTVTVQNVLIDFDFNRQWNNQDKLVTFDGDYIIGLVCGSRGPLPGKGRAEPCIMIKTPDHMFVVDTGDGSRQNLTNWSINLGNLDAVLLTHLHSDHISDLADFHLYSWVTQNRGKKLPVYGPLGTNLVTEGITKAYELDTEWRTLHHGEEVAPSDFAGFDTTIINLNDPVIYDDGKLKITAFEVEHFPVDPSLGYRFDYKGRSIVISGDTDYSENLVKQSKNADLLFHDALSHNMIGRLEEISEDTNPLLSTVFYDIQDYHASPIEAAQAANEANVKELIFYHLTPAPQNFIAKIIFVRGVNEVRPDNWTLADDGTMAILPIESEDITITNIQLRQNKSIDFFENLIRRLIFLL